MADKSVAAAVAGGKVTDTSATDIRITSNGDNFNGIIVRGDSRFSYSIINPVIKLTGNGGSDFVGDGAAIMTDGNADVTVNNASIINHGVIRAAVVVRGSSTIHVNNSYIEVNNGILPEKIVGMMQVPWVLGLTGNVRATNAIDNATAYYNNTHIRAQAWGAISTDATKVIRLYAAKCLIETVESGYGSYSIGDTIDSFSGCTFNVTATFRNMTLNGDIVNSMTTLGDMIITFKNASITGAITTGATDDKYRMKLFLDKDSKWIVDKTSCLNVLSIAESASIAAPNGCSLKMTVDGVETPIKYGSYSGKIALTVIKEQ